MRVLVCVTEYYPYGSGIANVAYNIVKKLETRGIDCIVCSPTGPDIILGNSSLIRRFGILGILHYWYQVSKFFNANNYDIAWLHNPLFLGPNPFKKYFVTMHVTLNGVNNQKISNSIFLQQYKFISSKIENFCLNRLDSSSQYSCVSPTICNELIQLGIPKNNITRILNGVNIEQFCPKTNKNTLRGQFGLPLNNILLLNVGRLTHQKQPFTLIKVFSHLEKELENIALCIASKGELLEATKKLVKKLGLRNVFFLGYVANRDLPSLYACADYYIITSKYEGLPLTLLEAMASGLPCIGSNIQSLEIVKDADCGILLNFENINSATEQIVNYLKNDHFDHSQNARKYVIDYLDWSIIADEYVSAFRKIQ